MLTIVVPGIEYWDEKNEEFINEKEQTLQLEHSLISISKWEQKWKKAYLTNRQKTNEELIDYIRCMTLTQNVDPSIYTRLTEKNFEEIDAYISDPMTAVYFPEDKNKAPSREKVTNEVIYYWMFSFGIPYECRKWHLNQLLALIKVCSMKNAPAKKRSAKEIARENAAINAARRKQFNTKG